MLAPLTASLISISKMGSSGINHQRITYQAGVGYTLKAVKVGGLSKKTNVAKVVQVRACSMRCAGVCICVC